MSQSVETQHHSKRSIDLDGLGAQEIELVEKLVTLLRAQAREQARQEFTHFWDDWKRRAPNVTEQEAEQVVEEAIAFARNR